MPYCDQIWSNFFFGKFWVFNFFLGGGKSVFWEISAQFLSKKNHKKICNKLPSVDSYMVVFFPFCFVFSFVFFVFFFLFFCFSLCFFLCFFVLFSLFFFLVCVCFFFSFVFVFFFPFFIFYILFIILVFATGAVSDWRNILFFSSFNYFCKYLRFYGMDCLGTYFTHIQIWNITRV